MKILYVGERKGNSLGRFNCLRNRFPDSTIFDVHDVYKYVPRAIWSLERRFRNGPTTVAMNLKLRSLLNVLKPDLVWTEMGREIFPSTLKVAKANGAFLINTYSDNFQDRTTRKVSRHYNKCIPLFDMIFTPRESDYIIYRRYGANRVEKFWKGFNPEVIKPIELTSLQMAEYGCDVCFAGHWEKYREDYMIAVAQSGAQVKIWGSGWEKVTWPTNLGNLYKRNLPYEEYPLALNGARICVTFTSKWANDTQNSRLFEIPGSRVCMFSERTSDAEDLFVEDKEAVFFSNSEELVKKVSFYLSNDFERSRIASAGFERAKRSYSLEKRVDELLEMVIVAMNQRTATLQKQD